MKPSPERAILLSDIRRKSRLIGDRIISETQMGHRPHMGIRTNMTITKYGQGDAIPNPDRSPGNRANKRMAL